MDGECTRFEVSRVHLEEEEHDQSYSFELLPGIGIMQGGVSVVELTEDHCRIALVQTDKSLISLRLKSGFNDKDSINSYEEAEAGMEVIDGTLAVSGCGGEKGMMVTAAADGQMKMFRLVAGDAGKEFVERDLINKFTFGLGSLGLGSLKKLVGRPAEATDRPMCSFCLPLNTGPTEPSGRIEEHFVFVLHADLVLRITRVDKDGMPHHDVLHALSEHLGLADIAVKDDLAETPHKVHCSVVPDSQDAMGPSPAPTVLVCVTVSLQAGPVVVLLRVQMGVDDGVAGEHAVSLVQTYHGLPNDVIEVKATHDYVWALCPDSSARGGTAQLLFSAVGQPSDEPLGWSVAAVGESVSNAVVEVGPYDSPEAAYAEAIFDRGTFSLATLQEALNFNDPDPDVSLSEMPTAAQIRRRALAVMAKVAASDTATLSQHERETRAWKPFSDDCVELWYKERAPRGLFVDNGAVFIVTQVGLEQVRMCLPCTLESVCLLGAAVPAELDGLGTDGAGSNQIANEDLKHLLETVAAVRAAISQELHPTFVAANPTEAAREDVDFLIENSPDVVDEICAKLTAVRKLPAAAERLLNLVTKDNADQEGAAATINLQPYMFKGVVANAMLVNELEHQIRDRVLVCRSLLHLTDIASRRRAQVNMDGEDSARIAAHVRPQTAILVRQFSTLLWAADQRHPTGESMLLAPFVEKFRTRVEFPEHGLDFHARDRWSWTDWSLLQSAVVGALLADLAEPAIFPLFLLELGHFEKIKEYVALDGGFKGPLSYLLGLAYLEANEFQKAKSTFLAAGATLGVDKGSDKVMRAFFSGSTASKEGADDRDDEPLSRVAFFTKVASLFESKIPHRLTGTTAARHESSLQLYSAPQMVIHFAREAINALDSASAADDAVQRMEAEDADEESEAQVARDELQRLRSMLVRHLLMLGHHDAAMTFVVSLPRREAADTDAQKKFLHLVIKQLCDREDFQTIVENSYATTGLEAEVEEVLKLKAIHTPIQLQIGSKSNFYMVLFSFHVRRGNYKDASFWMFVLADKIREHIRFDVDASEAYAHKQQRAELWAKLQCMSDAYASCISTLQLVSKDHQWHTEPRKAGGGAGGGGIGGGGGGGQAGAAASKRPRTGGGSIGVGSGSSRRTLAAGVNVVTLAALQRELLLARSEFELARYGGFEPPANGAVLFAEGGEGGEEESVRDTIRRLVNASMFDSAMSLAVAFKPTFASNSAPSPTECIFEALVDKCVLVTDEDDFDGAESWLGKNDLNPLPDVYVVDPNLQGYTGAAWEFLRRFLERHDQTPDNNFAFHRCVANRILGFATSSTATGSDHADALQRVKLPVWLVRNLTDRHGAALLDLYINHRQFDDAIALVHDFVESCTDKRRKAGDDAGKVQQAYQDLPYAAIQRLEAELAALHPSRDRDLQFVHEF